MVLTPKLKFLDTNYKKIIITFIILILIIIILILLIIDLNL